MRLGGGLACIKLTLLPSSSAASWTADSQGQFLFACCLHGAETMLQMPLPRMVSFRRSILNTGELGNNQNVAPASVAICHFPALPTPTTTDSGVDFGRARPRAWGSRKERWACEAHAEKWEVNRLLTKPNAGFVYCNSLIPRARAT
jgi:hypothetical protein